MSIRGMFETNNLPRSIYSPFNRYNLGHLIEGALAHHAYYKNDDFLGPIRKYVNLIHRTFGPDPDQRHGYPGHSEIELALLRLYKVTGDKNSYALARYFLEERGNLTGQDGQHYFDWERKTLRGESPYMRGDNYPYRDSHWYEQSHIPIIQQRSVEGHAVRCMYLLVAVADMISLSRQEDQVLENVDQWLDTLELLWNNMVDKKMYVTGGIGAIKQWEGFGIDYFLPASSDEGGCYAETCASIGVMMLAERLLSIQLDSKYADIMELSLYNSIMTAVSLDGRAFTYINQLASSDLDLSSREDWFEVSCCPPNLIRLFGSLGGYLWHFGENADGAYINVHLYTNATLQFEVRETKLSLAQETDWPWDGKIQFDLSGGENCSTTIRLRIPGWCHEKYDLQPPCAKTKLDKGYLSLPPDYISANPKFSILMDGFNPRYVSPHPHTNQNTVTLARGPIIYCVEDFDNEWEDCHFKNITVDPKSPVSEKRHILQEHDESWISLSTSCRERKWPVGLAKKAAGAQPGWDITKQANYEGNEVGERCLTFIPYYFRANRGGNGHMRVGILRGDST